MLKWNYSLNCYKQSVSGRWLGNTTFPTIPVMALNILMSPCTIHSSEEVSVIIQGKFLSPQKNVKMCFVLQYKVCSQNLSHSVKINISFYQQTHLLSSRGSGKIMCIRELF